MGSGDYDELTEDEEIDRSILKSSDVAVLSSVCELLQCPVCFNTMSPPIHQCFNGHVLCSSCKLKVNRSCPTCRCKLDNTRCLALEKVAACIELPCKYRKSGCPAVFPYCSKLEHETQCSFRPYNCPIPYLNCSFHGDVPSLVSHLKNQHQFLVDSVTTFNYRYVETAGHEHKEGIWEPTVISCFGQYFCLHFEVFQPGATPICIAVLQLIGNDEEAKSYGCSLEFEDDGRKKIWRGVPRSIRDNYSEVRDSFDGLVIQRKFFYGDGKELALKVSGRIWKEDLLSAGESTDHGENTKLTLIESGRSPKKWQSKLLNPVHSFSKKIRSCLESFSM